ncbi:PIG-L family deacetylase [Alicyclobacillus pomorum]|uniref:PIG-L family deacetylase n=1 Tax=Alicyclobacillus pomorum TaxID=204470 RepID=UPI0003F81B3E|nr:PIG-L family deacetylase [Alicyclobacillus pomorum]
MGTLMAVFAHPDDETFMCGGTLAKSASEGHRTVLLCATKGEMGRRLGVPLVATRESLPRLREAEMVKACQALGVARLEWLGLRDKTLEFVPPEALASQILRYMQEEKPDVVITFHEQLGGHPDHCAIGAATIRAFADYQWEHPTAALFFAVWPDIAKRPGDYGLNQPHVVEVDVSGHLQSKLSAYRAHRTQSQQMRWIWRNDAESNGRLARREYFIAHSPQVTQRVRKGLFA